MPSFKSLLANFFNKNGEYRSDATNFISDIKRARPELDAEQRAGRALLWDKNIDRSQLADATDANVKRGAYVYGTQPTQ